MGAKRPHSSAEEPSSKPSQTQRSNDSIHPSRLSIVPHTTSEGYASKKRKTNPHPQRSLQPKTHAINPLKSRIRSLQRLLQHDDQVSAQPSSTSRTRSNEAVAGDGIPKNRRERRATEHNTNMSDASSGKPNRKPMSADIRLGHERELQSLEWELREAEKGERKRKVVARWHMVRFFDRRKAERRLRRAEKAVRDSGDLGKDERKKAVRRAHEAKVDLNYALYFPLELPYSSLWPRNSKPGDNTQGKEKGQTDDVDDGGSEEPEDVVEESVGDREMWTLVEKCMKEGRLDDLRNGKIKTHVSAEKESRDRVRDVQVSKNESIQQGTKVPAKGKRSSVPKSKPAQEEEDESDGGFFE